MNNSNLVIWNSIVLYAKIIICIVFSLWTVPIILHSLGNSDFGLFALVAGVVAMLAFFKSALASSTQRFLSVARGEGNTQKMNEIFNSAIVLHLFFGIIIFVILEALTPFLFGHFLNIDPDRMFAGKMIYQTLLVSMFFSIMTVPFDAELNAYENMLVFAILEILDAILRLCLAFSLPYIAGDKLIWYGIGMAIIPIVILLLKYIYTRARYRDLYLCPELLYNVKQLKQMFSFISWNTFGALAIVGRNQGLAIILNLFYGTLINTSYGIANQINSVMGYFSLTIRKSIHPQLMQSEGMQNRERMMRLVFTSSKFSVLVMAFVAIPLIIELPYVLKLWLTNVPDYALEFTQWILLTSLVYQMSAGLMAGVLAVGKMKVYQIVISSIMLLNLPIAYLLLKMGYKPHWILISMLGCEVLSLIAHMIFSKRLFKLSIGQFSLRVILPLLVIIGGDWFSLSILTRVMETSFLRLLLNCGLSVIVTGWLSWIILFNKQEKNALLQFVNQFKHKLKR